MPKTTYDALIDHMNEIEIVDTHEHLVSEKERLAQASDFSTMFSHYCQGMLLASGMSQGDLDRFLSPDTPVDEKWRIFEPHYDVIQDCVYARAAHIAIEKLFGMGRLTSPADAEELTVRLRKACKPGLYAKVLKKTCRISRVINYGITTDMDLRLFAPVMFATDYAEATRAVIRTVEDQLDVACGNLNAYVDALWEIHRRHKENGMKGIKFHFAYMRDLHFAAVSHAEAEEVFLRIVEEGYGWRNTNLGYEEMRPFQDYIVHRFAEMAGELDMPIIFHTGLQGNVDANADDSRPLRLWNLPHRYRRTDFVLLHAGFPWMEDAALLAKHYDNVYLDLAWTHIVSPEIVTRSLRSYVDMVPMHKILGFGGDYHVVEKVYGHLTVAKQNIARALSMKVERGDLSLDRAKAWIDAMLCDNPKRVFRLEE